MAASPMTIVRGRCCEDPPRALTSVLALVVLWAGLKNLDAIGERKTIPLFSTPNLRRSFTVSAMEAMARVIVSAPPARKATDRSRPGTSLPATP